MGNSEWKEYKLSEIIEIISGGTPKTNIESYWNGNIPWLSVKDFNNPSKYVYSTEKTITKLGLENSATQLLQKEDIIISARGTVGVLAMTPIPMTFNQSCYGLRAIENKVENHFLYYLLNYRLSEIKNNTHGSVFDTITRDTFNNISVLLPPLSTQQKIASILSALDDKIELNQKINDNLEEQAQALFKSWFVDFEPFKDGDFVESELGMIPKGWKIGRLDEVADVTMGQSPSGNTYNDNGNGMVFYQGRAEFGDRFPTRRLFTTSPSRIAEKNSILISVRAPVGDINVAFEKCCIGRGLASILAKDNFNSFVLYNLKSMHKKFDVFNSEGTVFGAINRADLTQLQILIPNKEEIEKFCNIVMSNDDLILNNFAQIQKLTQLRDTLLPKLMSGEISVEEIEI